MKTELREQIIQDIERLDVRILEIEKQLEENNPKSIEFRLLNNQLVHAYDYLQDLNNYANFLNIDFTLPRFKTNLETGMSNFMEMIINSSPLSEQIFNNYDFHGNKDYKNPQD